MLSFKKLQLCIVLILAGLLIFANTSLAAIQPYVLAAVSSGDQVQIRVTGDPNSFTQLLFYRPGATTPTTVTNFGTTDSNGNLNTTISSGTYGISGGAQVYAIINGLSSPTITWPSYTSSLSLSQTNLQLTIGQNFTITASTQVYVAYNSNSSVLGASTNNTQVNLTANTNGVSQLTLCGANAGCTTVNVTVGTGGSSQNQITFSQNTVTLQNGQSTAVTIYGGPINSYYVSSNSNSNAVSTSINGSTLTLYSNNYSGSSTITICASGYPNNCGTLPVTTNANYGSLSVSQNTLTVPRYQSRTVTIYGGSGNYFISNGSANTYNSTNAINGATLTITGNTDYGSSTIIVCDASNTSNCTSISATFSSGTTASVNGLSFSIPLFRGQSLQVAITNPTGSSYYISSNSNSGIVSASVSGSSVRVNGLANGSSDIIVCQSTTSVCGKISVSVGAATSLTTFPSIPGSSVRQSGLTSILTWDLNQEVFDYDGYIIYRSESSRERGSEIGRVSKNIFTFTDRRVVRSRTYYYTILPYWGGLISNNDRPVAIRIK